MKKTAKPAAKTTTVRVKSNVKAGRIALNANRHLLGA